MKIRMILIYTLICSSAMLDVRPAIPQACEYQLSENITSVETGDYILFSSRLTTEYLVWDITTNSINSLPFSVASGQQLSSDTPRTPHISPDRRFIAYATAYSVDNLNRSVQYLVTAEGRFIQSAFVWQESWLHFAGWVDAEHMAFIAQRDKLWVDIVNIHGQIVRSQMLQGVDYEIDVSPWDELRPSPFFFVWSDLSQDSLVLWLRDADYEALYVFDLRTGEAYQSWNDSQMSFPIIAYRLRSPGELSPVWSTSGDKLALLFVPMLGGAALLRQSFNVHIYTLDGHLLPVTNFSSNDQIDSFSISSLGWSADDRYMAFWLLSSKDGLGNPRQLYVYDVAQQVLMDTGISASLPSNIIWSPLRSQLAFTTNDGGISTLSVVDVEHCIVEEYRYNVTTTDAKPQTLYAWGKVDER